MTWLLCLAVIPTVLATLCDTTQLKCSCLDPNYCVAWELGTSSITFTIEATFPGSAGWVGIGISNNPSTAGAMVPANVNIMWLDNGTPVITDRVTSQHAVPPPRPGLPPTMKSGTVSGSTMTVVFERPLTTNPDYASLEDRNYLVIWAMCDSVPSGGADTMNIQQHQLQGSATMNFFTGQVAVTPKDNDAAAHGVLMFIAYACLFPIAQIIARYLKGTLGVWWFRLHILLMLTGILLILVAFALVIYQAQQAGQEQFFGTGILGAHKLMGLFIVIFTLCQPLLGQLANLLWNEYRQAVPIWPDKIHWWVGRLVLLAALVQIGLGIKVFQGPVWNWVIYGIVVGAVVIAFLALEIKRGQVHHQPSPMVEPELKPAYQRIDG